MFPYNSLLSDLNKKSYKTTNKTKSSPSQISLSPNKNSNNNKKIKIGIALDKAFYFYYKDNIELLESVGFEITYFSPLNDKKLPQDLELLYIGGGYPELHAKQLSKNQSIIEEIRDFTQYKKKRIYAECGGLSYLSQSITSYTNNSNPANKAKRESTQRETTKREMQKESMKKETIDLVGLLPFKTVMTPRFKALGYMETTLKQDCMLGKKDSLLRGHAFHYSEIQEMDLSCETMFLVKGTRDTQQRTEGYFKDGVLASYIHQHFSSNTTSLIHLKNLCEEG